VLRPGGLLILGTPDYATLGWRTIEPVYGFLAPGAYRDEHITHYTRDSLIALCRKWGFELEDVAYVFRSELILALRQGALREIPDVPSPASSPSDVAHTPSELPPIHDTRYHAE
jgi:hypothetical protein